MKIAVLGAGLVGGPMAMDLAKDPAHDVLVADISNEALDRVASTSRVKTRRVDLSNADEVQAIAKQCDIVLSAVPSFMGFRTLEAIIETGKDVVDIAFFAENPLDLDALARRTGSTAICRSPSRLKRTCTTSPTTT